MRAVDLKKFLLGLNEFNINNDTNKLIDRYLCYKKEIKDIYFSDNLVRNYNVNHLEKHFPEYYSVKTLGFEVIDNKFEKFEYSQDLYFDCNSNIIDFESEKITNKNNKNQKLNHHTNTSDHEDFEFLSASTIDSFEFITYDGKSESSNKYDINTSEQNYFFKKSFKSNNLANKFISDLKSEDLNLDINLFKLSDFPNQKRFDNAFYKQLKQIETDLGRIPFKTIKHLKLNKNIDVMPMIKNILYLYSCGSKNEMYTQGIDSILYPLLNLFIQEEYKSDEDLLKIEVYTFLCFVRILYVLEDNIKTTFIVETDEIWNELRLKDPLLYKHLNEINVILYSTNAKWMISLFSASFNENLDLWYTLFERLFMKSINMARNNLIKFSFYLLLKERESLLNCQEECKAYEILLDITKKLTKEELNDVIDGVLGLKKTKNNNYFSNFSNYLNWIWFNY